MGDVGGFELGMCKKVMCKEVSWEEVVEVEILRRGKLMAMWK